MKKVYFLVLFLVISGLTSTTDAQLAIRAGVNFSELDFKDNIINSESRTGVQAGFTYTLGLSDRIGFRPGAILSIKGFKSLNQTGNLTYLEIPASFLFYVLGSSDGLFLEAGPYLGAMLGNDDFLDVDYANLDIGFNIGAGVKLGRFGAGITYGYGFANIIDGEFSMEEIQARNKNIAIYGMVFF